MVAWLPRLPAMVEVLLVLLAAWLIAGLLLPVEGEIGEAPVSVEQQSSPLNMKLLLETPLFGLVSRVAPAAVTKSTVVAVAPSRLNIILQGTVVADDRSAAIVMMQAGGEQLLFFIGDTMSQGVVLKEVEVDAIVVDNRGKLERITLDKGNATTGSSAYKTPSLAANRGVSSRRVSRSMLNREIRDFPKLLSQARVVPYFKDGKSGGFIISDIVSDSLYERVGLKNGDIIRKVNGAEVSGPEQAMVMFQQLQNAKSLSVEIMRAGSIQQLNYDIQ